MVSEAAGGASGPLVAATKQVAYGAAGSGTARVPAHGGNSAFLTAGIIVADVVGAGILSMAVAVRLLGWALGAIAIVLLLAMNVHISLLLWRVHMMHPEARTFMELTLAVCADLPEPARNAVVFSVGVAQSSFLFLVLGLYSLSIGEALGKLFYNTWLCLPLWTFIGSLLLLPVHVSATSLGTYKSLIWVNCSTILGSIFIPLVYMAFQGVEVSRPAAASFHAVNPDIGFPDAIRGLSIFAFAFTGQFILVEIISEMKDRQEFPKAYTWISVPFQCAAFLLVGLGGYYYKGDSIHGIIVDTIGFGPTFRLAAACLLSHMWITYLIKGIVFCKGVQLSMIGPRAEESPGLATARGAWALWPALVATTIATTWFTAQIIPFFNDLVDLLGSSLTPFVCWIVPIGLYVYSAGYGRLQKESAIGPLEKAVIVVEVALSLVLMVAGTGITVAHVFTEWHTYGWPFECHCETLWNSCDCSAAQPGMEYCGEAARAEALLSLAARRWPV